MTATAVKGRSTPRRHLPNLPPGEPTIGFEYVTPEMATEWLQRNEGNRAVSQTLVDRYARDLKDGSYLLTGEAIIFGATGRLLDGQHRLWASVESQCGFWVAVARGIPDEERVMNVIDSGTARTLGHVLQIAGEGNSNALAAAISTCWRWQRHRLRDPAWPSRTEAVEWLKENGGIRQAVQLAAAVNHQLRIPPSAIAASYYMNSLIDAEASERFWNLATTGEGLLGEDPILAFRRFVIQSLTRREKPEQRTWLLYCLKAMNLWREGKHVRLLSVKDNEMPEPWSG